MSRLAFLLSAILLFLLFFILAVPFYSGDIKNHLAWGASLLNFGPLNFYDRAFPGFAFPNYPPFTMALFALSIKLYQLTNSVVGFLNTNIPVFPSQLVWFLQKENVEIAFLKLPAILSNFVVGSFLFLLLKKKSAFWIFLLNPAAIYLSVIWGQIDFLPLATLLPAIYFLNLKKVFWAGVFLGLSVITKQTVIIFLPFLLLLIWKKFGFLGLGEVLGIIAGIFYLAFLPFHSPSLIWPIELYRLTFEMVGKVTSTNAINFWGFIFNFKPISDNFAFLNLSYQNLGYLLFAIFLIPPFWIFWKSRQSKEQMMAFFLNLSLLYFFFFTRIHERYLAPAIVFLSFVIWFNKKYAYALIYFSAVYFINLYRGNLQPDIPVLNFVISSLPILKALVVGYFIFMIYSIYLSRRNSD